MQKIEADLQSLIRIFSGMRIEDNYENDNRTSKFNCESRKGHSIKLDLLEKRFVFDIEKQKINLHVQCQI